jgi:hypothetical protein
VTVYYVVVDDVLETQHHIVKQLHLLEWKPLRPMLPIGKSYVIWTSWMWNNLCICAKVKRQCLDNHPERSNLHKSVHDPDTMSSNRLLWWDVMRCDEIWCDVMRCDEMWWDVMRRDELRWVVMRFDAMWWDVMRCCDDMWWHVMRCDEMWRDVTRCDEMLWWDVMRCDEMWWDVVMRCDEMWIDVY